VKEEIEGEKRLTQVHLEKCC